MDEKSDKFVECLKTPKNLAEVCTSWGRVQSARAAVGPFCSKANLESILDNFDKRNETPRLGA